MIPDLKIAILGSKRKWSGNVKILKEVISKPKFRFSLCPTYKDRIKKFLDKQSPKNLTSHTPSHRELRKDVLHQREGVNQGGTQGSKEQRTQHKKRSKGNLQDNKQEPQDDGHTESLESTQSRLQQVTMIPEIMSNKVKLTK